MPEQQHPQIPGLVYVRDLGAGGFADVYLYRSVSLDRDVAVKVLRAQDLNDKLAKRFASEANDMAKVGDHPNIVQVFGTGITADGRPYIEMAYYPGGSLADKLRQTGQFGVAEVLRIGVKLAAAIETAHRAELLHRDIKPANVLVDGYGEPAITDFGIASRVRDKSDDDSAVSLPWAPPELLFLTAEPSVRSDVYSLAATLWNLLVGRAPYEMPGGDNGAGATMMRTRDYPVPSTGRGDVPTSLDRLLAQAMSKNPAVRPATAENFARALNLIEDETHYPRTPLVVRLDLASQQSPRVESQLEDRTRRSSALQVVHAQGPTSYSSPLNSQPLSGSAAPPATFAVSPAAPEPLAGMTVRREDVRSATAEATFGLSAAGSGASIEGDGSSPVSGKSPLVMIAIAVLVIVAFAIGWFLFKGGSAPEPPNNAPPISQVPPDVGGALPPGEVTVRCKRAETDVTCTWAYSNAWEDDSYRIKRSDGSEDVSDNPEYVAANAPQNLCIAVKVVRANGSNASREWSSEACA